MNKLKTTIIITSAWVAMVSLPALGEGFEYAGSISFEWREYLQSGQWDSDIIEQPMTQAGLLIEPEFAWSNDAEDHVIVFKPFLHRDSADKERTHWDIRELSWLTYGDTWELKAGISKVFWGVTESQHLVDIINQSDTVEAPDGEDKLGQPMIKATWIQDWGMVDVFVLPGFRERTFSGEEGRYRGQLVVSGYKAQYQAAEEAEHVDYALRWSHTISDYDVGLSWFQGTSRDPLFVVNMVQPGPTTFVPTELVPYYPLIKQAGVDAQATIGSWLWKLEVIHRDYNDITIDRFASMSIPYELEDYTATTAGLEYTFYDTMETGWDLGTLLEYQYDSREDSGRVIGQNDVFVGGRLAFNDTATSEILFGVSQDLDDQHTRGFLLEAKTRMNENYRVNIDIFLLYNKEDENLSNQFRRDDYVQFTFEYNY